MSNEDTAEAAARSSRPQRRLLERQQGQLDVLTTELDEIEDEEGSRRINANRYRFWERMEPPPRKPSKGPGSYKVTDDPYFDYVENIKKTKSGSSLARFVSSKQVDVPTLRECQAALHNKEAEAYHVRKKVFWRRAVDTILNILAALYVYCVSMLGLETIIVIVNAGLAAWFYSRNAEDFAVKLDFSFLSFAVVFPLTFLVQSCFGRREQALVRLSDFKAALLSTVLFTLTVDWPSKNGEPTGGRLALPETFSAHVMRDCRELVQLVYEYLSMPSVSHARNMVFTPKQKAIRRVHGLQNDIIKRLNGVMFDLSIHTEVMRKYGFPSGEASRLHQYHQYLQQRFEQLRVLKYYRTPQATRSFGRAYILILPWISGPYFAWVYESTNYAFAIILACFTFVVVLGLLYSQQGLEDPFLSEFHSLVPGIDNVKLDFEMASILQAMEQYHANAEIRRLYELEEREEEGA